eukprot:g1291.t1
MLAWTWLAVVLVTMPAAAFSGNQAADNPLSPGTKRIARERGLSLQDFYEKYADKQIPVIIEDTAHTYENMTAANLKDVCGNKEVSVARRVKKDQDTWAGIDWESAGKLGDVMQNPGLGEGQGTVGVFDWSLARHCPEMLKKHYSVPKYVAQDYLQRIPHSYKNFYRDAWPSLFVGADTTFGACHKDVFGSAFWQYVIEGEKEWHIVDNPEGTDFYGGAEGETVNHYHDIVAPGELLIIPGNCFHQVRNKGITLSLAGNYVGRGNLGTMRQELEKGLKNGGGEYYRQTNDQILRQPDFDYSVDVNRGDMTWAEFRNQAPKHRVTGYTAIVSGAGSVEVNGRYEPAGKHSGAHQFEMRKDGRIFELFKVDTHTGWWNIIERFEKDGKVSFGTVVYGAKGDSAQDIFPPAHDWGSTDKREGWLGTAPGPGVTVERILEPVDDLRREEL